MRYLFPLIVIAVFAGCATVARYELDREYGAPDPARNDVPQAPPAGLS